MLGRLSAAGYKKKVQDFLGEDARIQRKLATKEACELILDNAPKEADPEVKLEEGKIEREFVCVCERERQ